MQLAKVRRGRLWVLLFLISAAAAVVLTGSWRQVAEAGDNFYSNRDAIEFEDYARAQGTTPAAIRQQFYDDQMRRYNEGRAKGLRDCSFYWSNEPCLHQPLQGTWARGPVNYTFGQNAGAVWLTLVDARMFFFAVIGVALGSWALLFILPAACARVWRWLTAAKPAA